MLMKRFKRKVILGESVWVCFIICMKGIEKGLKKGLWNKDLMVLKIIKC